MASIHACFHMDSQECEDSHCSSVVFVKCGNCGVRVGIAHFVERIVDALFFDKIFIIKCVLMIFQ